MAGANGLATKSGPTKAERTEAASAPVAASALSSRESKLRDISASARKHGWGIQIKVTPSVMEDYVNSRHERDTGGTRRIRTKELLGELSSAVERNPNSDTQRFSIRATSRDAGSAVYTFKARLLRKNGAPNKIAINLVGTKNNASGKPLKRQAEKRRQKAADEIQRQKSIAAIRERAAKTASDASAALAAKNVANDAALKRSGPLRLRGYAADGRMGFSFKQGGKEYNGSLFGDGSVGVYRGGSKMGKKESAKAHARAVRIIRGMAKREKSGKSVVDKPLFS